jgi:hypothetical protein
MPGKAVESVSHQTARRCQVTAAPRKLRPEIDQIRTAERRVCGQPVETIFGIIPEEPVEQCEMPFGEVVGAPLTPLVGRSPARGRLRRAAGTDVVERVEVLVGKGDPVVRHREQALERDYERGLLLAYAAEACPSPPVLGLPTG